MAIEKIHIDEFLALAKSHPVIDVRSPGEYNHAHIPCAHNLPLFTDEERKMVGTAYKQESREKAIKIGLDFFGPKMRMMVEQVESIVDSHKSVVRTLPEGNGLTTNDYRLSTTDSRQILLYCWRGGMRSAGVGWLMDLYGFKVYTLSGGYKKFRNYILDTFKLPLDIRIVGGYTGSGKTGVLKAIQEKGEPVVDLEAIAHHKGSAFGNIGMAKQPGQEMFENILATEIRKSIINSEWLKTDATHSPLTTHHLPTGQAGSPLWLEDESQRIGLVNIPNELWHQMRQSPVYFLDIPFEERLTHLVREYGGLDKQAMIDAIGRIRQKLGGLQAKNAVQLLEEDDIAESFRILLKYYDRFYFKALHNREGLNSLLYMIRCKTVTPENASYLVPQPTYQPEKH